VPTKKKIQNLNTNLQEFVNQEDTVFTKGRFFTSSLFLNNTWKNHKRNWGHSLHSMASRSGSFPPALANYFISNFSNKGDIVVDPFSGKGTTALEACINERIGIGLDVAPEAFALTSAKTISVQHDEAVQYLNDLVFEEISKEELNAVPQEVKIFYSKPVLEQILAFRKAIEKDFSIQEHNVQSLQKKNTRFAKYWTGVIIGILHGSSEVSLSVPCSHSFSMAPNYVKNYSKKHGLKKPIRDLKECLIKRSAKLLNDNAIKTEGKAILGSAMNMPKNLEADLIVTSPPYFTAQSYAWDNWLREWYLGYDFKEVRKETLHTSVEEKYRLAMAEHLKQAYACLKPKRWAFYVVGDVIKKMKSGSYKIITAEIIAQEAQEAGFSVELIINDNIPEANRYNSAFLNKDQGLKLDRIVCLYKN
jgi:DNA modification methylase